jgi:hypothetical protein
LFETALTLAFSVASFPLDISGLPAAPENRSLTRFMTLRLGQVELVSRHRDSLSNGVRVWRGRARTPLDNTGIRCSELSLEWALLEATGRQNEIDHYIKAPATDWIGGFRSFAEQRLAQAKADRFQLRLSGFAFHPGSEQCGRQTIISQCGAARRGEYSQPSP